jgi:hypothetical protein
MKLQREDDHLSALSMAVSTTNLRFADVPWGDLPLVEASLTSSARWAGPGVPVSKTRRRNWSGWTGLRKKKIAIVYQTGPLLTVALATGAFGMPRPATPSSHTAVLRTPIHRFFKTRQEPFAELVSGLQGSITLEDELESLTTWPPPSPRATTPESAQALQRATQQDPAPTLPPLVIDDGLGI